MRWGAQAMTQYFKKLAVTAGLAWGAFSANTAMAQNDTATDSVTNPIVRETEYGHIANNLHRGVLTKYSIKTTDTDKTLGKIFVTTYPGEDKKMHVKSMTISKKGSGNWTLGCYSAEAKKIFTRIYSDEYPTCSSENVAEAIAKIGNGQDVKLHRKPKLFQQVANVFKKRAP